MNQNRDDLYQIETRNCPVRAELNWKISGTKMYLDYICSAASHGLAHELEDLFKYLERSNNRLEFKWNLEVGTIQFTIAVLQESKEIKVASKQLHMELNLEYANEANENFAKIIGHIECIAQIPTENTPTMIEYLSYIKDLSFFGDDYKEVHELADEYSKKLIKSAGEYKQSLFEKITDFGLGLTANFMLIRIHLLKFLAILPNLHHDKNGVEVKSIFHESFRRLCEDNEKAKNLQLQGQQRALPDSYIKTIKIMLKVSTYIPSGLLATIIRYTVSKMAKRFIAGEDIRLAKHSLQSLSKTARDATIDQLGELVVSKLEADIYTDKVLDIIKGMDDTYPKGTKNSAGLYRAHVSIKVTALCHDFKPYALDYTYEQIAPRLFKILLLAKKHEVFINVDAEHYHYRDAVLEIYAKVLESSSELADYDQTGIVVQAYLRDGIDHLKDVLSLAKRRKLKMPIRLVKGAYWDAETIEATAHNFEAPQFLNKEETDIHFRQLIEFSLQNGEFLQIAVASHNIQDHCFSEAIREKLYPNAPIIEHQCLHMTYEALSLAMAKMNWPTRNYIPVGDLLVGMAYLVRRIMENSSQVGVLTIMRSHKKMSLLKKPSEELFLKKEKNLYQYETSISHMTREFKNIFPIRSYLKRHFIQIDEQLNQDLERLKANEIYHTVGETEVFSSSNPDLLLGKIQLDDKASVDKKIQELFNGFQKSKWSKREDSHLRYYSLSKLADLLLYHRVELTSLIMIEAGKTIDEAIADVDEAIDFILFYTREQIQIEKDFDTTARGVVGVIAPWNFPLAILCGMTVAPLTAGNTVIVKPAEQTPLIALRFLELCRQAGLGEDILQMSLGEAEVGQAITSHDLVVGCVFTGSVPVGKEIYKKMTAQKTSNAYDFSPRSKFAITEMGGKNAIIVTNNSELDEVVSGIIYSSFAHAGQKCSAASRIIIDENIKSSFIDRFSHAVKDLKVGTSYDYATMINPLIGAEDKVRVQQMAKQASEECLRFGGKVIVNLSEQNYPGHCVGPSVFEMPASVVLTENDLVAKKEVFGPLVHIIPYKTQEEALRLFNETPYALTGGLFCQSQDDIDTFSPYLEAGNLYVNRPNTGARVGIEPFGGFKMSGTGPKAGGVDYMFVFNHINDELDFEELTPECEVNDKIILANTSGLRFARRESFVKNLLELTLQQFEVLFAGINEEFKQELVDFYELVLNRHHDPDADMRANRKIPGQLSYSQNNMSMGNGILIDFTSNGFEYFIKDVFVNLFAGNGLTIMVGQKESYDIWIRFVDLAYQSGFSHLNLTLVHASLETMTRSLLEDDYQFVLLTGGGISEQIKTQALERDFTNCLPKFLKVSPSMSFEHKLIQYTQTRAFAINVMRHGAPLEIELNPIGQDQVGVSFS